MLTAKSLIYISFILAFAVALQSGDQVAFMTDGNHFVAQYQYLNAGTVGGTVGMAANTDYASVSGTWWEAQELSDGSWAFASLGNIPNDQHIFLNANTYTGAVDLAGSTNYATTSGTHWNVEPLSDGTFALQSLGSFSNPNYVYLNVNTYTGAVNLAGSTNYATTSGTHWTIVTLVPAGSESSIVEQATGPVIGAVGTVASGVANAAGTIIGAATGAAGAASGAVNSAVGAASGAVNGAVGAASGAVNGAVGAASGAVNSAVGAASGAVNSAVGATSGAVNSAVGAVSGAVGDIGNALSSIF
jgi:hypothetical protein